MSTSRLNGALSPPLSRSAAPSPRPKFPSEALRPYLRTVLAQSLVGVNWDPKDKPRMSKLSKDISEEEDELMRRKIYRLKGAQADIYQKVKSKMLELQPRGFKYIVTVTLSENLGQAGRADMTCHWEDTDTAIQEMWSNDSLIFVCVAFAVRVV